MSSYWAGKRVLCTGGSGFIGQHLVPMLRAEGATVIAPTRAEIDLEVGDAAAKLAAYQPHIIFHLAAFFGGVHFVSSREEEIVLRNAAINITVMKAAALCKPVNVVVAASACAYSPEAPLPFKEEDILKGELHPSVAAFGESKRALIRWVLEQGHRAAILTTVYGPGDHIGDPVRAHFLGGILGRMELSRRSKSSVFFFWGTGAPIRDVVYVTDAANALLYVAEQAAPGLYNVAGRGERNIRWYAERCAEVLGYTGRIGADATQYGDGQAVKYLDCSKISAATEWMPHTAVIPGLQSTINWMHGQRRDDPTI